MTCCYQVKIKKNTKKKKKKKKIRKEKKEKEIPTRSELHRLVKTKSLFIKNTHFDKKEIVVSELFDATSYSGVCAWLVRGGSGVDPRQ